MQKGFSVILLILGILIASGGVIGGAYFYNRTKAPSFDEMNPNVFPSVLPNPTNSEETLTWKTYTDEEKIFLLKYPNNWHQNACGGAIFNDKPFNDCGSEATYPVSVGKHEGNVEEYFKNQLCQEAIGKDIVIQGKKYKQFTLVVKKNRPEYCMVPDFKTNIYTVFPFKNSAYYLVGYYELNKEGTDYINIYNQILSTFKFTDLSLVDTICAQVITKACSNTSPTICRDFPTPCDVPSGWAKLNN